MPLRESPVLPTELPLYRMHTTMKNQDTPNEAGWEFQSEMDEWQSQWGYDEYKLFDYAIAKAKQDATDKALDIADRLWGVVANVSGGDWMLQNQEWREAAEQARDDFHEALRALQITKDEL